MSLLLNQHDLTGRMMGEILISQQWVTPSELEAGIHEQERTQEKLGAILVRLGFLSEMELDFILAQQKGNTLTGEADNVTQRLGDILTKSKRLSRRELDVAVDEQQRTNEKLGEVLLRLGLLAPDELEAVLAWQEDFQQADPLVVRALLGEILIASKRISRKQLEAALSAQRFTKKQIGQILVESGHVSSGDLQNALKIQTKLVAAGLLAMMSAMALTGCGAPQVNNTLSKPSFERYNSTTLRRAIGAGFERASSFRVAALPDGRQIQLFADGSKVIKDVPFYKQGRDNTCAQASAAIVLNYWGVEQGYQELVDEQNRFNLPTTQDAVVGKLTQKGLQAKAFRNGNFGYLKSLVDQGKPAIVLLQFNNSLTQQHYVTVIGYNNLSGKIIFHDSIDGPYRQLDEDEFFEMWQAKDLANLPLFGGGNYRGLIIEAQK